MEDLSRILARIERLERSQRRWQSAAVSLAVVWLAVSAAGFRAPARASAGQRTVEAERFVLRGPDGSEHGSFGLDRQGFAQLQLTSGDALFLVSMQSPGLLLRGTDGKRGAFLGVDRKGSPRLELNGPRLMDGIRLTVQPEGGTGVHVLDETGRERAGLDYHPEVGSQVAVRDELGRSRSALSFDAGKVPSVVLLDEAGRKRLGMLLQPDETSTPLLALEDGAERTRMEISTHFDGSPFLRLYREDGGTSYELP